jgi:hypothetical protein
MIATGNELIQRNGLYIIRPFFSTSFTCPFAFIISFRLPIFFTKCPGLTGLSFISRVFIFSTAVAYTAASVLSSLSILFNLVDEYFFL